MSQTVKYLKDYTTPNHLVPKIHLLFDVSETHAHITAQLHVEPQNEINTFILKGKAKLISIALNGNTLPESAYSYDKESETLTLPEMPAEPFILTIETELNPAENKSFNGLYASGGNLYTQCEPEGFRTMTYHPDRPDVMGEFTTEIRADEKQFPVLLSNGNKVDSGSLKEGRHFAVWHDPFAKPSYLFALVAGDLACTRDTFTTRSGRNVAIEFYTRQEDADKVAFAVESLKNSMKWDEERFGLEYDLDIYMVVAVGDFNMGAMENKGLNIFNTKYVLADSHTATDADFEGVEGVIGHEYFHNWTGNRVTCRDWFQLSLKEGLTVFRDQEFSGDRASRAVRRIENVNVLRTHQFAEDASPMAHPVRPASYVEMNNFYTVTVYEKGAEVVRMYHTFLGEDGFQKGMKLYFERHDGQAVTCDDFRNAMADANGVDFSQFTLWYSQAGTPTLDVSGSLKNGEYVLNVKQILPDTPDQKASEKQAMMMPLSIAFLNEKGEKIAFRQPENAETQTETVLTINQAEQSFKFLMSANSVTPSLLRGFSAPVHLNFDYTDEQLALLLANDDDPFARWEAGQTLYRRAILANEHALANGDNMHEHGKLIDALRNVLNAEIDPAFKALLLKIPTEAELWGDRENINPVLIAMSREALLDNIAHALHGELLANALNARELENADKRGKEIAVYEYNPKDAGLRSLQYACFALIHRFDENGTIEQVFEHYDEMARKNMTHEWGVLSAINHNNSPKRDELLNRFAAKFADQALVMDKYFMLIASSRRTDTLAQVQAALSHPQFSLTNPNKVRSLIGVFARNVPHFHAADGSGYAFVAEKIREINAFNPQVAAGLARTFNLMKRIEPQRQALMRGELEKLAALDTLSKDVREIVEKILA
ncbi:aminopeptidase N [Kingella kingae]|uniref:aminopeptidase N n=2 Tax=Kingella kingae TaxID=504 RepID=UPI00254D67E5|nr:aminopeptidase N [Kingella kingae]MDK4527478.1 aminopeptidase N [Kingella kingae]MDK4542045.1 aminopeptidase N [Kingella kingae]MDK4561829.1 aminopeptidase N [Kingella kingae]MDK4601747.1 aminopeptidase N [Kingella kingae]MDK4631758.1 aminopeptidase N [Kingella kingae]